MPPTPRRLKPKRVPLLRRPAEPAEQAWDSLSLPSNHLLVRKVRAVRRAVIMVLWTLLSMVIQSVLLVVPGPGKVVFARIYWAWICRIMGLKVRMVGRPARRTDGRPVIFVSNHSSWLDIPVLGGRLHACFISKEEIGNWPFISWIAKLGRTVFVRRQRATTARERDEMTDRLAAGDNLILFPEGTTSDGSRVLPFRSAFLSLAEQKVTKDGLPPIVQPLSVVYDRLGFLPTGRAQRPLFAWYGDMDIGSHYWRLGQNRGLRATILLHAPLDPRDFPSRKALANATWEAVANGAAALRQNRPVRPISAPRRPEAPSPSPASRDTQRATPEAAAAS